MGVLHWAGPGDVGTAGEFVALDHLHPERLEDSCAATTGVQVEMGRGNAPALPGSLTLLSRSVIFLP